jgi:hypothetical protein
MNLANATNLHRKSGAGGMTNLRAVAHLGMRGSGWTESKKPTLDKTDSQPSPSTSSGQALRDSLPHWQVLTQTPECLRGSAALAGPYLSVNAA